MIPLDIPEAGPLVCWLPPMATPVSATETLVLDEEDRQNAPVCVSIQMPRWLRDQARELAEAEALTLSSYIRVLVIRHVRRRERER